MNNHKKWLEISGFQAIFDLVLCLYKRPTFIVEHFDYVLEKV